MPGFELIDDAERAAVNRVFDNGGVFFRHGFESQRQGNYAVRDFEHAFAETMQTSFALAVSSGTAGLRVALAALGIGKGDEVITQSFTFVATVEAIIESGATPICANVDETLNIDFESLKSLVTARTKAVIPVHMLGTPSRMREIVDYCSSRGISVIEDTAWGCGGKLEGRPLGTWGDIGVFSFDHAKAMTTGEGGMVVTDDSDLFGRAAAWHDHGHENNASFPRWEDTRSSSGFNFRMTEFQGAVGAAQLGKLGQVIEAQTRNYAVISNALAPFDSVGLRVEPYGSESTFDGIVLTLRSSEVALMLKKSLTDRGLPTKILPEALSWHFAGMWDHMPELVNAHRGELRGDLAASHEILTRCVALPNPIQLRDETLATLIDAVSAVEG